MLRAAAVVVLVLTGALVAEPAGAAELGTTATRRTVEQLVHRTYPFLAFGNVACPPHLAKQRGARFTCTVQLPGAFLVVDATETDGRGTVSFTTQQAVIAKGGLEQFVAANTSIPAKVDCGSAPWHVVRPRDQIACTVALADGSTRHIELTVNDTAGNVTITGVS